MKKILQATALFLIAASAMLAVAYSSQKKHVRYSNEWEEAISGDTSCCFKNYSGPGYFLGK